MSDKFAYKYKAAFALYKHKVYQNKKRILAIISEFLKSKLEQMIWQEVLERTIHW
jgi:hypothetical protein